MGYSVIFHTKYNQILSKFIPAIMNKEDEKTIRKIIKEELKEELAGIDSAFVKVSERFDIIDEKFVVIDKRFDAIDERFDRIEGRLDVLEKDMTIVKGQLSEIQVNIHSLKENNLLISNKLFKHDEILSYLQSNH